MPGADNFEIADLPDGRFEVRILGGVTVPMSFATRAEAEEWVFQQSQTGDDPGLLTPGIGEGAL